MADDIPASPKPVGDDSHLCKKCKSMTYAKLKAGFNHHSSYEMLQANGKTCHLCALFIDCLVLEKDRGLNEQGLNLDGRVMICFDYCGYQDPLLFPGEKDYDELVRIETNTLKGYLRINAQKGTA